MADKRLKDANDLNVIFPVKLNGKYAVEFDETKLHQVYIGDFYKPDVIYDEFFCHALIKPTHSGYFFADGDGGNHNLLFGVGGDMSTGFILTGNFRASDGSGAVSFVTAEKMRGGEWAYVSIWYDKNFIILCINGVVSAIIPCVKRRSVSLGDNGCGVCVGGTDHNTFGGRIAAIGIMESVLPYDQSTALQTTIRPYVADFTSLNHNVCLDFRTGSLNDIGFDFIGEKYHGSFCEMNSGATRNLRARDTTKFPAFVVDPFAYTGTSAQKTAIVGARIYDDFSGADQHKGITNTPTIGTTRVGSKTYVNGTLFGKQFGAAYALGYAGNPTIITDNQSDGTIIWRRPTGAAAIPSGSNAVYDFYFRYTDADNNMRLYVDEYGSGYIFSRVAGSQSNLGSVSFGANFSEAKIVLSGTSIKSYANGVLKHDLTSSENQTATGKGFNMSQPVLRLSEWGVI